MDEQETVVETPAGAAEDEGGAAAGTSDAAPAKPGKEAPTPKTSGNKWTDLAEDIAAVGKSKLGELTPEGTPEGKAQTSAKPKGEGDGEGEAERKETGKPEGEEEEQEEEEEPKGGKEKGADGKPAKPAPSRYAVVAEDGSEFEFEALPKGAKIVFQLDKKKVEVTSLNDLVTLAQQGAALRTVEGTYQRKLAGRDTTITALTERLSAADKAFREIVEDDEKLEDYRARAKKLSDPEYREGLEAKRKLGEKEEQEAEEGEELREQVVNEFWDEARQQFDAKLEDFPTLTAEDYPDVARSFWDGFQEHRQALQQEATERAGGRELKPEELEAVDAAALEWLTEENLEAAMQQLHEKIEQRLARTGARNGKRKVVVEDDEEAAKRDAARHNKHVDDKLRQRGERVLRGGGSPPGPGGERQARPASWADHMAGIHEEFDRAKKPAIEH